MKKSIVFFGFLLGYFHSMGQRYLSEVFPAATVQSGILYSQNISMLSGSPLSQDLHLQIYSPAGLPDSLTERPLILFLHGGSFLPPGYNNAPTGDISDSSVVELCTQFAKRGYVAAVPEYRIGWFPSNFGANGIDIRSGTYLQALYRGIQDAKAAVRFFKENYSIGGNAYGIDTSNIILMGMGSGGWITTSYLTLNDTAELSDARFVSGCTDTLYHLSYGKSYVDVNIWGDPDGFGGNPIYNNSFNHPGYSGHVSFAAVIEGGTIDPDWLQAGDIPLIAFHCISDPFYSYNDWFDPTMTYNYFTGIHTFLDSVYSFGNNQCFASATYSDLFSAQAISVNGGIHGLYPFVTSSPENAPWEWYDSTAFVNAFVMGGGNSATAVNAYSTAIQSNPGMSKTKAMAYIDTIMGYFNPRWVQCMTNVSGIPTYPNQKSQVSISPNPSRERLWIKSTTKENPIQSIYIYESTGRYINGYEGLNTNEFEWSRGSIQSGLYLIITRLKSGPVHSIVQIE